MTDQLFDKGFKLLGLLTHAIASVLALMGLFLLQGCSESTETSSATQQTHNRNQMQVLVLVPQYPDTDDWSAQGQEGAKRIEQQLNARVTLLTGTDPKKISQEKLQELVRPELDSGVQLIIGVGGQYEGFLRFLSSAHPYVRMAIVGEIEGNQRNLGAVAGRFDDIGYVFGRIAYQQLVQGDLAENPKTEQETDVRQRYTVGFLGGIPFKAYQKMAQAFDNALNVQGQAVDVMVDWVGSFAAPDLAYQKAKSLLDQGVQVLFINTGMGNAVIAELMRNYPEQRLLIIDTDDRSPWNSEQILATGIIDVAELIVNSAKKVSAGHWYGQQEWFSFKDQVAQIKLNQQLINTAQRQAIFMVMEQLNQGLVMPTDVTPKPVAE